MKGLTTVLSLALVLFLAGCGRYYYQEGKTYNECERDWAICVADLEKQKNVLDWGAYEYRFVEDCMKRKGYKLVGERSLPLDAKRRDPDRSTMGLLRGRRQGVAGTVQTQ
jgi:hypothetical protein